MNFEYLIDNLFPEHIPNDGDSLHGNQLLMDVYHAALIYSYVTNGKSPKLGLDKVIICSKLNICIETLEHGLRQLRLKGHLDLILMYLLMYKSKPQTFTRFQEQYGDLVDAKIKRIRERINCLKSGETHE